MGVKFPGKKRYVTLEWPLTIHGLFALFNNARELHVTDVFRGIISELLMSTTQCRT